MPNFAPLGIDVPDILLPAAGVDLRRWAVVAADQYTSQPEYWQRVESEVGDSPSTLRLILPEVYLDRPDVDARIEKIHATMRRYLQEGVFAPARRSFVYVDRRTAHVLSRKGLMVALDLEAYDYRRGADTLVRATEHTVQERLPPRVRIREHAPLELTHVMVLIDDPDCRVIEPLAERTRGREPLYQLELLSGGGAVSGWAVDDDDSLAGIHEGLSALADPAAFRARYGVEGDVLLYAMGDGNHSLAAAKVHWERVKAGLPPEQRDRHPARHALVELVNLHDAGLVFEPIHRVVFGVDPEGLLAALADHCAGSSMGCQLERFDSAAEQQDALTAAWQRGHEEHVVGFVAAERRGLVRIQNPRSNLAVGSLQGFLDEHLAGKHDASIDYIHGQDVVGSLCKDPQRVGFLLPAMDKNQLFKTVIVDGVLPRKTFSMGEAEEKRYYLEARRIN